MTRERAIEILDKALDQLGEHFDAVQICVSEYEGSVGTTPFHRGTGNFFARRGLVEDFLMKDRAEDEARILSRVLDEDDDEDWKQPPP